MSNQVLAMPQSNDLDVEKLADVLQSIVDVGFRIGRKSILRIIAFID